MTARFLLSLNPALVSAEYVVGTAKIRLTFDGPVQATSLTLGSVARTDATLVRRRNTAQAVASASVIELATQSLIGVGTVPDSVSYSGTGGLIGTASGLAIPAFTDVACPPV